MTVICDNCGEEVTITVIRLIEKEASSVRSAGFTATISLECSDGCTRETPRATELTTIDFPTELPAQWSGSE